MGIIAAALLLDQITKHAVRVTMELGETIPVIGSVLRLTYIHNPGIAFGIRIGNTLFFTVLSFAASMGVGWYLVRNREESMLMKGSLALIIGGALGNLVDRILFSEVVDFIDVGVGTIRWPVFNLADASIVAGMFLLFIFYYKNERCQNPSRE